MKTVFTNDGVCHAWAHGSVGIRNGKETLYVNADGVLFSYGTHYPMAQRLNARLFAVTSRPSASQTTSMHLRRMRQAIPHDATRIPVKYPGRTAAEQHDEIERDIQTLLTAASRARKRGPELRADALRLAEGFNAYAEARGEACRIDTTAVAGADLDALRRLANERDAAARRAVAEREARVAAEHAALLETWRQSGPSDWRLTYAPVALRVRAGWVETSRGVNIPVEHAVRVWPSLLAAREQGKALPIPQRLGIFGNGLLAADGTLTVGCHRIAWAEIERVADALGLRQGVPA